MIFFANISTRYPFINNFINLLIILLFCLIYCYNCDENYYITTDSSTISNYNINLIQSPIIINKVITSNIYQADTIDNIYITYIGNFAISGPHLLSSSFQRGK